MTRNQPVASLIRSEIAASGPIPFARFMELALYSPAGGFFTTAPPARHFATAPHLSEAYSLLLAGQIRAAFDAMGRPPGFTVVEVGAGEGTLARALRHALGGPPYLAVERDPAAAERLRADGFRVAGSLEEAGGFTGVLLANEVLDNIPFHLLRGRDGAAVEVFVDLDGDGFVEVERPATTGALAAAATPPRDGEQMPVSPGWIAFVTSVAAVLERGYAFLVDYGFTGGEPAEPVRGYRDMRRDDDVLADPGTKDITGPVDFDVVASAARAAGLQVWGPVSQRDALHALGYRDLLDRIGAEQRSAEDRGDHAHAVRLFGARGDAAMLVDPAGLGGLKVLALGTGGLEPPQAVRG